MSEYTIKSLKKPYGTPLAQLCVEGGAELMALGFSGNTSCVPGWDTEAFYAELKDGSIAGVLVWNTEKWRQEAWIDLGYVRPAYRGQGIYTALYAALVEEAKSRGLRSVAGGIDAKNTRMLEVAASQGRSQEVIVCRTWLPFTEEQANG